MSAVAEAVVPELEATEPKKGSKKKLLVIILAVLLLGGGGGGGFYFLKIRKARAAEAARLAEEKKAGGHGESEEVEVKHVIELQPFIINLADRDEPRYLRMTVGLGIGETENAEKADPILTSRARDAILAVLSTKTSDELLTTEGKNELRKLLLERVRESVKEPEIKAIFITDFIIQM